MATATTLRTRWQSPAGTQPRQPRPSRLLEYFVVLEIICQLALLSETLSPFRVIFRMAVFGVSLVLLFLLRGRGKPHPAGKVAIFVMVILALSMLNPGINSVTAAAAEFGLYLSVLAPLFWVARVRIDLSEM